ncbi:MAG: GNAT family N-acetyltransferase [Halofilum sp. (in: g-proteobacteria)]
MMPPAEGCEDRPAAVLFSRKVSGTGELALRPLNPEADARVVHGWVTSERARFWGMQALSVGEVAQAYREIVSAPHSTAYIGMHDCCPAFLVEIYDPAGEPVGQCYEPQPTDRGMHLLIAESQRPIHGFTWQVFTLVMDHIFRESRTDRVVVEPDVRNERIHAINRRAGFVYHRRIELPDKTAWLVTCTRAQYHAARRLGVIQQ